MTAPKSNCIDDKRNDEQLRHSIEIAAPPRSRQKKESHQLFFMRSFGSSSIYTAPTLFSSLLILLLTIASASELQQLQNGVGQGESKGESETSPFRIVSSIWTCFDIFLSFVLIFSFLLEPMLKNYALSKFLSRYISG